MTFTQQSDKRFDESDIFKEVPFMADEFSIYEKRVKEFYHSELRAFAEEVKKEIIKYARINNLEELEDFIQSKLDELIKV